MPEPFLHAPVKKNTKNKRQREEEKCKEADKQATRGLQASSSQGPNNVVEPPFVVAE